LTDKDIASVYYAIGMDPTERPLPISSCRSMPSATRWSARRCRRRQLGGPDRSGAFPTVAIGTPFHTWQIVAQGKTPAAHKAMVQAAKAMAGLGVQALNEPDLIEAAKADLKKRTARTPYVSPLPDNVAPPLDMSVN